MIHTHPSLFARPEDRIEKDDHLCHLVCCVDDDIGVCGTDLSRCTTFVYDPDDPCVVCDDLWHLEVCPHGLLCPPSLPKTKDIT